MVPCKQILIVDDDTCVRHAIRTFIENRSRFAVTEAVDGSEALQKAAVLKPDLIVLDLSMPTANGVDVAALLRSRTPSTPVVIYTMYGDIIRESLAKILGIAARVPIKSDGVAKLLSRIQALIDSDDAIDASFWSRVTFSMRSPVAKSNRCAPVLVSYSAITLFTSFMSAVAGSYSRSVVSPREENGTIWLSYPVSCGGDKFSYVWVKNLIRACGYDLHSLYHSCIYHSDK